MSGRKQSHLVTGLRLLGERWTAGPRKWVAAGTGVGDKALRWILLGIPAYIAWRIVSSSWKILGVTVLVVCVLALRAATKAVKGEAEKPKEAAREERTEMSPEAFLTFIWGVLDGSPAVHLATLADHLHDATGDTWTGETVRAACTTHDIPIRPKVRDLGGDRVSSGVHRDDLDPLPQPLPEGATEGDVGGYVAGQDGNATPLRYEPTSTTRRVGDVRIVATDDPHNPARTHVRVIDPTRPGRRKRG